MGMLLVAATIGCADGVPMATITSGLSPTNFLAIWPAVPALAWALWKSHFRFLPGSKPSAISSSLVPSRTASSAGCSTKEVMATTFSAARADAQMALRASAPAMARNDFDTANMVLSSFMVVRPRRSSRPGPLCVWADLAALLRRCGQIRKIPHGSGIFGRYLVYCLMTVLAELTSSGDRVTPCFWAAAVLTNSSSLLLVAEAMSPGFSPLRMRPTTLPVWRPRS